MPITYTNWKGKRKLIIWFRWIFYEPKSLKIYVFFIGWKADGNFNEWREISINSQLITKSLMNQPILMAYSLTCRHTWQMRSFQIFSKSTERISTSSLLGNKEIWKRELNCFEENAEYHCSKFWLDMSFCTVFVDCLSEWPVNGSSFQFVGWFIITILFRKQNYINKCKSSSQDT